MKKLLATKNDKVGTVYVKADQKARSLELLKTVGQPVATVVSTDEETKKKIARLDG
jgi:hypothetical protein